MVSRIQGLSGTMPGRWIGTLDQGQATGDFSRKVSESTMVAVSPNCFLNAEVPVLNYSSPKGGTEVVPGSPYCPKHCFYPTAKCGWKVAHAAVGQLQLVNRLGWSKLPGCFGALLQSSSAISGMLSGEELSYFAFCSP